MEEVERLAISQVLEPKNCVALVYITANWLWAQGPFDHVHKVSKLASTKLKVCFNFNHSFFVYTSFDPWSTKFDWHPWAR